MASNAREEKITQDGGACKDFAGIKAVSGLFVATPQIIDDYIRRISSGQTRTIQTLRAELSRKHLCTATCLVSTAIFVRIPVRSALEELADGEALHAATPFWRLIDPDSMVALSLTVDPQWIAALRATEQVV